MIENKTGKGRALLGMSGGVDSSVAAALLIEKGYNVVGVTMKLYDYSKLGVSTMRGGCCGIDLIDDARMVCSKLKIPHYVLDFTESFQKRVIDNFAKEYSLGRTPNPCIDCNTHIKWGELLKTADKLDCDFIATGHYARIKHETKKASLCRAADLGKDQTYALWGIPKTALSRTIFPLGEISKTETRKIAEKQGFRNADRPDSQEICFIPDDDYANVLRQWPKIDKRAFEPGPIIDAGGDKIGEHEGFVNYTIGQRRGLGISAKTPLYVIQINPDDKSVVVGEDKDLFSTKFKVSNVNLLIGEGGPSGDFTVKIRYRHEDCPAHVSFEDNSAIVTFEIPQRAVTPGQSAVFYSGDVVVGGGIIDKVIE